MPTELLNGFGKVYLTIDYDAANRWVYNDWIGDQTYVGIVAGADACLPPLRENQCAYLLNDNRRVTGPWEHAVDWLARSWAPRAIAQGLTHFANVVSPEKMAASSAQSMLLVLHGQLQTRMFDNVEEAQEWLHQAQRQKAA
jgi:hypothetical protein